LIVAEFINGSLILLHNFLNPLIGPVIFASIMTCWRLCIFILMQKLLAVFEAELTMHMAVKFNIKL